MINTNNSKIGNPFPFRIFCQKVIPLAFDESLSYLELLYSLLHYLRETVIPAVNNNADAVTELQNLYNELKTYVDNYFENLDVQEEINNKLDEMAESGQLTDIIAQYLELAGVLAYDTINDLKNADNLTNGSIAKTLGNTTYNDGYGAFYKIRTILNTDVVDNDNIVALANFNNLIAEKIKNQYIEDNRNNINIINSKITICIGDSYGEGVGNNGIGWVEKLNNFLNYGNNLINKSLSGTGFLGDNPKTFLTLLQEVEQTISNKELVKNIIVCGGYNEYKNPNYQTNPANLDNAINQFYDYAKLNFPNAKIYLGFIGNNAEISSNGTSIRSELQNTCFRYKMNNHKFIYMEGIENIMHNYDCFSDNIHPNNMGYNFIGLFIYNALNGQNLSFAPFYRNITPNNSALIPADQNKVIGNVTIINNMKILNIDTTLEFNSSYNLTTNTFDIGSINANIRRNLSYIPITIKAFIKYKTTDNNYYGGFTNITINDANALVINNEFLKNDGTDIFPTLNVKSVQIKSFNNIFNLLTS